MKETQSSPVETKTHTFTVEVTSEELEQIQSLKRSGRKIGHFVKEAVMEKLARERRGKLEAIR